MSQVDDFTVLIDDDRSSVYDLRFVQARNATRARQIADRILGESSHHKAVQVWSDDTLIYAAGRPSGRTLSSLPA